jgi:hypothetical protein
MMFRMTKVLVTTAGMIFSIAVAVPNGFAQQDTKGQPTASGQMKEAGNEVGKAGKSLGSNVKHGQVVRGGKHFGKHLGYAGRHVGSGTKKSVKKVVTP